VGEEWAEEDVRDQRAEESGGERELTVGTDGDSLARKGD
jgi:hypothetical protein